MPHRSIVTLVLLLGGPALLLANTPPDAPLINEPELDGQIVNPSDVHMECAPFSDADPGDTHLCSDWEIWTVSPPERVWFTACIGGVERVHTHLGDGAFENSHTGRLELFHDTDYRLRTRHRDSSGDPPTEWSAWSERLFTTGAATSVFPLELDDILDTPAPTWVDGADAAIVLPSEPNAPHLRVESLDGELLLELAGLDGLANQVTNPAPLAEHAPTRVMFSGGGAPAGLALPDSDLSFVNDEGENVTLYLPAVNLGPGEQALFWVSADGSTYAGDPNQTAPSFAELARGAPVPWIVSQPGYKVEVVATGFQLPVNIAFVPSPGPAADDPFFYVTELYGTIKVISRDGTVSDYASGLLNFNPTGAFPGSGEQGLAGIAVDPNTGDVFATLLYDAGGPHYPKVDRFSSLDGGRTAATQTTILDMVGESQGQSHQISNISFGPDGRLYVHMGDGFDASTAQNLDSFRGKVLRLNRDGSAPADNPFYNAGNGITARDYVYAYGLRNPFGGAWRASDAAHYEVENGPSQDRFARVDAGVNYLWDGSNQSMTNLALHVWNPAVAPVNLAFIETATFAGSGFPAEKLEHAFVTESGPTWATGPVSNGKRITEFVIDPSGALVSGPTNLLVYGGTGKATAVGLAAGPDGLYFSDLYKDADYTSPIDRGANVLRVRWVGTADFTADVTSGAAPLTVSFQDLSNVPGATAWSWDFGDGGTSALANPVHQYTADGIYDVQLRVTGSGGVRIAQKTGFVRVGELTSVAFVAGANPPGVADQALVDHLFGLGYDVSVFDDEPANRPTATQLAADHDLVLLSSTITSGNVGGEFRDAHVPLVYWEQALNASAREPLASGGATFAGATEIDILTSQHPVTYNLPAGTTTAFSAPATISLAQGSLGAGVTVLATRSGAPGDYAILAADSGATLLGGHIAPARRTFLYLEDASWLTATPATRRLLEQAILWSLGQPVPTFPGDFDRDGDFDADDLAALADCLAGPDNAPLPTPPVTPAACRAEFDRDLDSDCDLADILALQRAQSE